MFNMLCDIALQSYDDSHIYRIYNVMPLMELMKEYKVVSAALSMFHENDLGKSLVVEYLSGVVQIIRLVISDRVSDFINVDVLEECI